MSLIIPQSGWANCTTNISGTPSATPGTTITAGTANADGSTTSLIAAIGHDVQWLSVGFSNNLASATDTSMLVDIMIDPAGGTAWATTPIINDLLAGYVNNAVTTGHRWYNFPIFIKSGSSIGARCRCATASRTVQVVVKAQGGLSPPDGIWYGSKVQEIGITAASSLGQAHTPGNTGAFSAWTNLGSTLTQACGALVFGVQGGAQTTLTNIKYHWQFGVASTQIGPTYWVQNDTGEIVIHDNSFGNPVFCSLPAGTQLQVRATASGTAQSIDVAAYAVC